MPFIKSIYLLLLLPSCAHSLTDIATLLLSLFLCSGKSNKNAASLVLYTLSYFLTLLYETSSLTINKSKLLIYLSNISTS